MVVLLQLGKNGMKRLKTFFVQPKTYQMSETPFLFIGIFEGASHIFLNLVDVDDGRVECGDEIQRSDRIGITFIQLLNGWDKTADADIGLNIRLLENTAAKVFGECRSITYFRLFIRVSG